MPGTPPSADRRPASGGRARPPPRRARVGQPGRLSERTVAIRSWRSRRSAGRRSPSSTSRQQRMARPERVRLVGSPTRTPAVTAGRIASRTSARAGRRSPRRIARRPGDRRRPRCPRTRWVASGSAAIWPARVSVRVRGSGPVPPRRSTATSSSTKNGLPSDRAWIRVDDAPSGCDGRRAPRPGGRPRRGPADRGRAASSARRARAPPARSRPDRPAASSSVRTVSTSEQALPVEVAGDEGEQVARRRGRPSAGPRRRGGSASSATRSPGGRGPYAEEAGLVEAARASAGESSGRPSAAGGSPPMPGQQPGDLVARGTEPDATASGGRSRRKPAQRLGDRGVRHAVVGEVEATADQDAHAVAPRARHRRTRRISRVLPIPASPATTTIPGSPSAARASAARRAPSSGSRPTSSGLETRLAIARVYARPVRMRYPSRLD